MSARAPTPPTPRAPVAPVLDPRGAYLIRGARTAAALGGAVRTEHALVRMPLSLIAADAAIARSRCRGVLQSSSVKTDLPPVRPAVSPRVPPAIDAISRQIVIPVNSRASRTVRRIRATTARARPTLLALPTPTPMRYVGHVRPVPKSSATKTRCVGTSATTPDHRKTCAPCGRRTINTQTRAPRAEVAGQSEGGAPAACDWEPIWRFRAARGGARSYQCPGPIPRRSRTLTNASPRASRSPAGAAQAVA